LPQSSASGKRLQQTIPCPPAPSVGSSRHTAPPPATPEATFLKRLHKGACASFGTTLGPEANEAHRDHFHLDVKERRSSRGVCH
jgi:hypothetical protein